MSVDSTADAARRACANCVYFDPSTAPEHGLCRRNAPSPAAGALWPRVRAFDWCGEHRLAPPSNAPHPRDLPKGARW